MERHPLGALSEPSPTNRGVSRKPDREGAFVLFASFAGATGDVFTATAGSSAIWSPDGLAVARAGPDPDGMVVAALA